MDCRQVLSQFAAHSAEDLPEPVASALKEHLARCPQCRREWVVFEQTLLILSTTSQPILTRHQSDLIWQSCSAKIHQRIEAKRKPQRPFLLEWATNQPRWGWAALGGALAVLGGAWFLNPPDNPDGNAVPELLVLPLPGSPADQTGSGDAAPEHWVAFERPPAAASTLVDHHAALALDPFTDRVGSILVSSSATADH